MALERWDEAFGAVDGEAEVGSIVGVEAHDADEPICSGPLVHPDAVGRQ